MTTSLAFYPLETRSGAANLAADEWLLERAAATGTAALRVYLWDRPTLSLGYFQPLADAQQEPRWQALPVIRRSSGGAAILHGDGDITYSLALPPDRHWHAGEPWLCRFHHLLQAVFRQWQVPARAVACGQEQKLGPVLCFLDHTPGDLVIDGQKVVGSAQRKLRGALSQHGTIRLRTSDLAPELPGLYELTGQAINADTLAEALVQAFAADTGWSLQATPWTAEDEQQIARIQVAKYANPAWTAKR